MSNINKQALREAAEKAVSEGEGNWQAWREAGQKYPEVFTSSGHIVATVNGAFGVSRSNFIAAANPSTMLALLDELEAAEKRIAELEAKLDSADKLQDSAFRHGLQHGFSLGQTDNQAGFEECLSAYGTGKGE